MPRAIWNDAVLAEASSDDVDIVENNVYFPPSSVNMEYFQPSDTHTVCPWKGTASYYTVNANGQQNKDAAWFYPAPKDAAKQIKDHVAFWRGVKIEG